METNDAGAGLLDSASEWVELMYEELMRNEDDPELMRAVEKCCHAFESFMQTPVAIDYDGNAIIAVSRKYFGDEDIVDVIDRLAEEELKHIYLVRRLEKDGKSAWIIRGSEK